MPEHPPSPSQLAALDYHASLLSIYEQSFPSSTLDRARIHADMAFACQDARQDADSLYHIRASLAMQAIGEKNEDVAQTRLSLWGLLKDRRLPPLSEHPPSGASKSTWPTLAACKSASSTGEMSSDSSAGDTPPLAFVRRRHLSPVSSPGETSSSSTCSSSRSLLSSTTTSHSRLAGALSASRGGPLLSSRVRPVLITKIGEVVRGDPQKITSAIKHAKLQRCEGGTRLVTRQSTSPSIHPKAVTRPRLTPRPPQVPRCSGKSENGVTPRSVHGGGGRRVSA